MPHRDNLEAAKSRVAALERDLDDARDSELDDAQRITELEERLEEAQAEIRALAKPPTPRPAPRRRDRASMKLHASIALIVAGAVGGLVFLFVQIGGDSSTGVKVGARTASACTERAPECLPKLAMTDREGIEWNALDFENKVVVVNVWATWCGPCKQELPELVELRKKYGKDDVLLLGILTDQPGEATVSGFVQGYKINYPIIPLTGAIDEAFASPSRLPTTFVYDRSGHLAHQKTGAVTLRSLRTVIDGLL